MRARRGRTRSHRRDALLRRELHDASTARRRVARRREPCGDRLIASPHARRGVLRASISSPARALLRRLAGSGMRLGGAPRTLREGGPIRVPEIWLRRRDCCRPELYWSAIHRFGAYGAARCDLGAIEAPPESLPAIPPHPGYACWIAAVGAPPIPARAARSAASIKSAMRGVANRATRAPTQASPQAPAANGRRCVQEG